MGGRALAIGVASLILLATALAFAPVPVLEIEVAGGQAIQLALRSDGEFVYRYRQSVYDVPVEERYRVEGDLLRQVEIRSSDRRAIEYYALPFEPKPRDGALVTPGNPRVLREIRLQVLRDQEQSLQLGAVRLDLSKELGDARLILRPASVSRAAALLHTTR